MKPIRHHNRSWAFFLLLLFSFFAFQCSNYRWQKTAGNQMNSLPDKPIHVTISANVKYKSGEIVKTGTKVWDMNVISLDTSRITGVAKFIGNTMPVPPGGKDKNQNVHLRMYLNEQYATAMPLVESDTVTIKLSQFDKMEVYRYDKVGSAVSTVFLVFGVILLVSVIALIAKGASCPFIYADNPDGKVFIGEIFSGATAPQLERHDWLPLPGLQPNNGAYRLSITNEVPEIQNTNLFELVAVDHPAGTEVLFDKYGRLHSVSNVQMPRSATDLTGFDVQYLIAEKDSLRYTGLNESQTPDANNAIILEFKRPHGADSAKLVINAKNTMWLDVAHGMFIDEFGVYAHKMKERRKNLSREELEAWMVNQNIPLSVSLETAPGKWQRVDGFNLAGPMALRQDVLPINLSGITADVVRIRLESGFMFWEIDQVGMDFTKNQQVANVQTLSATSATDQSGKDRLPDLVADDNSYYSQPNIGDAASVVFPLPAPLQAGMQRSVFLHAKGHYEILHEAPKHRPDRQALQQRFEQPNSYPLYAREKWNEMLGQTYTMRQPAGH